MFKLFYFYKGHWNLKFAHGNLHLQWERIFQKCFEELKLPFLFECMIIFLNSKFSLYFLCRNLYIFNALWKLSGNSRIWFKANAENCVFKSAARNQLNILYLSNFPHFIFCDQKFISKKKFIFISSFVSCILEVF